MDNDIRQLIPNFSPEREKQNIIRWIKDYYADKEAGTKAFIGISGGKDSTIAAHLLCEALGPGRVYGLLMPDGTQADLQDAYQVIKELGIEAAEVNIGKITNAFYHTMDNAVDPFTGSSASLLMSKNAVINMPPRIRMAVLRSVAQTIPEKGFFCNTCNRSEDYVGYSTKDGDAAGDFSPLSNYTVTELLAIGHTIKNVSRSLIDKTPSDGLCGKTDEDRFGFSYFVLDRYILTGICEDPEIKEKIDRMHKANLHKLLPMPSCPKEMDRILNRPYTLSEIKGLSDAYGSRIGGVVKISIGELLGTEAENFPDVLSLRLTGTELLQKVRFNVVGNEGNDLLIKVSGVVS